MNFKEFCETLERKIQESYTNGITMQEAERLAGEFLTAQIRVSEELKSSDLDSRMKKSGLKSIKAAIYLDIVQKADKKPTETQIASMVDSNELVTGEQTGFDEAEVNRDALERYYQIFREAHIFYRSVAKGNFGG